MSSGSHSHQMINTERNKNELGIALEYPFQTIGHSNNSSVGGRGAGVNAGESINMGFAKSIPFAELVWSPRRGLKVNCGDKQSSLVLDVGPSNVGSSPVDSEPAKQNNGSSSAPSLRHEGQIQNCGNSVEGNTMERKRNQHFNQVNNEEASLSRPKRMILDIAAETSDANARAYNDEAKPEGLSGSINKMEHIATTNQPLGLGTDIASQSQSVELFETNRHGHSIDPDLENKEITSKSNSRKPNKIKSRGDSNSQESMESCSCAALLKGKRRLDFEPETTTGTKKMKMLEGPSQLAIRPIQSSFMNWISNVVKGLPKKDHEPDPCASPPIHQLDTSSRKPHILGSETKGFQSFFKSICNTKKVQETVRLTEDCPVQKMGLDASVKGSESCRRSLDPHENLDHFTAAVAGPSKHTLLFPFENKMVEKIFESDHSSDSVGFHHRTPQNDNNPFDSMWIKQFYPIEGPNTGSSVGLKRVVGMHKYEDPIIGLPVAMTSIFKKTEALKQNMLDITKENVHTKKIKCFFCGNTSHELRDCLEVKGDLVDLLGRFSPYGGTEDPRAFCIRCFEFDHWAITCPFASSRLQCERGSVKCTSTLKMNRSPGKEKHGEYDSRIILDEQRRMFDYIRRLWFSRADIVRFMYSYNSLSDLNGSFVRLRVGNCEGELGDSQYHVASIIGPEREKSSENSNDPLRVNICGINCSVDIKYVSNHDFLEGELKDWWEMTARSANIPNEDELKRKIEERKKRGV